jgi:hypothetical protein
VDVKEAVKQAKSYAADIFADEGVTSFDLEEVEQDDATGDWRITFSMSKPGRSSIKDMLLNLKVVTLRSDGSFRAITHRSFVDG